jgi:hypothetical protein
MANRWQQGYWRDDNFALLTADSAGVKWRDGERLNTDNSLATTSVVAGCDWRQGHMRNISTGALLVTDTPVLPLKWRDGLVVDQNNAIAITNSLSGAVVRQGYLRSAAGLMVVAAGVPG